MWSTFHTSFISWAISGLLWAYKWTDSGCQWLPCMLTSEHTVNIYCKEGASCPLILNIPSHSTFHSVPFRTVCLEDVVCPSCLFSFSLYLMKDCSSKLICLFSAGKRANVYPTLAAQLGQVTKIKVKKDWDTSQWKFARKFSRREQHHTMRYKQKTA